MRCERNPNAKRTICAGGAGYPVGSGKLAESRGEREKIYTAVSIKISNLGAPFFATHSMQQSPHDTISVNYA